MWDCYECGTEQIINQEFCPTCFAKRPEEESGEMAESDSKTPDAGETADAAPAADAARSEEDSPAAEGDPAGSGYSETEPSAGGFLTDWGR